MGTHRLGNLGLNGCDIRWVGRVPLKRNFRVGQRPKVDGLYKHDKLISSLLVRENRRNYTPSIGCMSRPA